MKLKRVLIIFLSVVAFGLTSGVFASSVKLTVIYRISKTSRPPRVIGFRNRRTKKIFYTMRRKKMHRGRSFRVSEGRYKFGLRKYLLRGDVTCGSIEIKNSLIVTAHYDMEKATCYLSIKKIKRRAKYVTSSDEAQMG